MKAGKSGRTADAAGAREHNLKNVDIDIPRDALVVFTGVSGSGKSSLAFGTLYAEARRRCLESVAPYARRLFHEMGIPDVGEIGITQPVTPGGEQGRILPAPLPALPLYPITRGIPTPTCRR